jgi:hypothetical protein
MSDLVVWKYPMEWGDKLNLVSESHTFQMPRQAQVLTLQLQQNTPTIWALVNPQAPKETRVFATIGTSQPFPVESMNAYVGTWQHDAFVWHVFEVHPTPENAPADE